MRFYGNVIVSCFLKMLVVVSNPHRWHFGYDGITNTQLKGQINIFHSIFEQLMFRFPTKGDDKEDYEVSALLGNHPYNQNLNRKI